MSTKREQRDELYEYAARRTGTGLTREQQLVTGTDQEALNGSQTLIGWARDRGHCPAAAWRAWRAGLIWCRRRDARGLLRVTIGDELRAAMDAADRNTINDAVVDAAATETTTTEATE